MILVTGATGQFGKLAIDFLLKKGVSASGISALVRDESKAQDLAAKGITLKKGDYDDFDSLLSAFAGVSKLLFVSGNDLAKRSEQHENVVKAAVKAGVRHIVYTSVQRVNETATSPIAFVSKSHLETEQLLKESGIGFTILKNSLYADFIPMFIGEKVLETGIFFPAGNSKGAFALRSDMAEATAEVLSGTGHLNKEYLFSNTEGVSFEEIAAMISGISGKTVGYTSPDIETFKSVLSGAGVPDPIIGMSVGFGEAVRQNEFSETSEDLKKLLGRNPVSVNDFLVSVYSK